MKAEVNEELRVHELHQNLKKAEQQGMQDLNPAIKDSVDELQKAADSVTHSYKKTASDLTKKANIDEQK